MAQCLAAANTWWCPAVTIALTSGNKTFSGAADEAADGPRHLYRGGPTLAP